MKPPPSGTFSVVHLRVETARPYDDVTKSFLAQLGSLDSAALAALFASRPSAEQFRARLDAMAGTSGFMLFGTVDHGTLLSVLGSPRRAVQYVIGNPLIAHQMTQHRLGAGLYAPLRTLIYEDDSGQTCVEYDRPSSLFGRFGGERIDRVGRELDHKMDRLVTTAVAVEGR